VQVVVEVVVEVELVQVVQGRELEEHSVY